MLDREQSCKVFPLRVETFGDVAFENADTEANIFSVRVTAAGGFVESITAYADSPPSDGFSGYSYRSVLYRAQEPVSRDLIGKEAQDLWAQGKRA